MSKFLFFKVNHTIISSVKPREGTGVGINVGSVVGRIVGTNVQKAVGLAVGIFVSLAVGTGDGGDEGAGVGAVVEDVTPTTFTFWRLTEPSYPPLAAILLISTKSSCDESMTSVAVI